ELPEEPVQLLAQRPFRIAALLADRLARSDRERVVLEQHHVHLDERRELGGAGVPDALGELPQLVVHLLHGAVVAALLACDIGGGDLVVVRLGRHAGEEVHVADRDPARHADAVHREAHGRDRIARAVGGQGIPYSPSSNFAAKSASTAARAASSSGPSASTSTVEPIPAASIITPMMLFAFTRRPARAIQTALLNCEAVCVSFAEARACRPSLFVMVIERFIMDRSSTCAPCA